jgi:hypothetical protein
MPKRRGGSGDGSESDSDSDSDSDDELSAENGVLEVALPDNC